MKSLNYCLTSLVLPLLLTCSWSVQATAPRIGAQLFDERKADIVAYETTPLITATQADGGLAVAVLSAAFNATGQKLLIDILPAKPLAKYALLNNEVIAMVGDSQDLSVTEKTQVLAQAFYLKIGRYFYLKSRYPSGLPGQGKLTDLKGLKYGGLYGSELAAYKNAGIATQQGDVRSLFEKLRSQELDFIAVPDLVGEYWLNKAYPNQQQEFASIEASYLEQPLYILFAKSHPRSHQLHKALQTGLDKIINNGQYQQLLEKVYGKEQVPTDFAKRLQSYRSADK